MEKTKKKRNLDADVFANEKKETGITAGQPGPGEDSAKQQQVSRTNQGAQNGALAEMTDW